MTCAAGSRRTRTHANIPVIMITSLQIKKERIKGIEAGAEDFISKPIDQGEVLARITHAAENERIE